MTESTSFWYQALKKGKDVFINVGEEIVGDKLKGQIEDKLKPALKLLESPEGRQAFDKAFDEAAQTFLAQAPDADERQLRQEVQDLLLRAAKEDLDIASREVMQRYVLASEPDRRQLDRWVQRQLGGEKIFKGDGKRVYTQSEITAALDVFFQELSRAFWNQPLFREQASQTETTDLLRRILARMAEKPDLEEMRRDYLDYLERRWAYLDLGGIAPKVNN
ncbi:MAG: hypothetical protein GY803_24075, partial [Chloroflexi bacterium]|nr:hypothetical protein [Chloroflexota bacterium]